AGPTESLQLVYRINGGPPQTVVAELMWKSPGGKGLYFRAYIPAQNPGERIDYTFRLGAGDDNPMFTEAGTFGSFIIAFDAKVPASPKGTANPSLLGTKVKAEV